MIVRALKLYRQSQTRRYQRFVRINIPQFTLEYHNEGKIEAVHRVIVGKASGKKIKLNGRSMGENQTPTMTSTIEQVVINPRWYVSDRIRLELSQEIAADPSYLERHGYVQMASSRYPSGEPRLIQLPGPNNALGRVRFDFPNAYAVYMHDTPNQIPFPEGAPGLFPWLYSCGEGSRISPGALVRRPKPRCFQDRQLISPPIGRRF